jgi:hypothetical protein
MNCRSMIITIPVRGTLHCCMAYPESDDYMMLITQLDLGRGQRTASHSVARVMYLDVFYESSLVRLKLVPSPPHHIGFPNAPPFPQQRMI